MIKNKINWKLYFVLLIATIISIIAVLPYAFTLSGDSLNQVTIPFPILVLVSIIQSTILFAIVIFLGLKLADKTGLGMPFIENYISKKKISMKPILSTSIILGIICGILIILADFIFTKLGGKISLWSGEMPPFWMGFLASFYGGIAEEILLRLFFMTLLVWLFSKLLKSGKDVLQNNYIMWSSIIIASIIFGLGHLPITSAVIPLTPIVIARAIVLNGIGGIIFGWLYWKKGLESSMIAHFSTDIILHVLFPVLLLIH